MTDGWFDVNSPEFSSDGKYLFFVSERAFNPTFGQTEWNHIYTDMQQVFLVTLAKETKSPFAPKSDEVKIAAADEAREAANPDETARAEKPDKEKDNDKDEADEQTKKDSSGSEDAKDKKDKGNIDPKKP